MCTYAQDANGMNTSEEVWPQEIHRGGVTQLPPAQQCRGQALNR